MSMLPLENNGFPQKNNLFDKLLGTALGAYYGNKNGNFLDGMIGGYIGYKQPNSLYNRIMDRYLPNQTTARLEQGGGSF